MRLRISRKIQLGLIMLIGVSPMAWEATRRFSTFFAVPSGWRHTQGAKPAAPDDQTGVPGADNFLSMQNKSRYYCHAGSFLNDPDASGFGTSGNLPRQVSSGTTGRGLFLLAQPEVVTSFAGGSGMRLTIVNQTHDLLTFAACDSYLPITQEAQDVDGSWQPIDELKNSDCGNSYHRVFPSPNHFWSFAAPRYKGPVATKLRFTMRLADGSRLHSNEFDGSIHQSQFSVAGAAQIVE